ncbi:MAG: hypothetical protein ABIK44_04615 [candidate division WOR-3 bacterium]
MKRLLFVAGAIVLILVGAGCTSATDDYYPMSVGSTWNMEGYVRMVSTLTGLDTLMTSTIQTKVEREAQLNSGEKVREFSTTTTVHQRIPDSTYTQTSTSYIRETGSMILGYESLADSVPDTLLVLPLTVGKTWRINQYATAEVVGQEDVTVKAGTYQNAWKIKTTTSAGITIEVYSWYAKNVGHVKSHYELSIAGYTQIFHQELVSCEIK